MGDGNGSCISKNAIQASRLIAVEGVRGPLLKATYWWFPIASFVVAPSNIECSVVVPNDIKWKTA